MIAKLRGTISDVMDSYIILMVDGIGYRVEGLVERIQEGQEIEVFIYTHVREQELRLFGFDSKQKLVLFEKLLNVQGVGPKIATKLVNNIPIDIIVESILQDDYSGLKVPGLGEKLAKKIILDLKNKVTSSDVSGVARKERDEFENSDLIDVLVTLGYKKESIVSALKDKSQIMSELSDSDRVKYALKIINNKDVR